MKARKEEIDQLDPVLVAVIHARMDGIIREMVQTVLRTSRNPILYSAKDFSCSILTHDAKLLTMADSIPIHLMSMGHALPAVVECFKEDLHPGDCFLNNDPYSGNSHVGDHTMFAPVFYEGELICWVSTLCHLIDAGGARPSSTDPLSIDVFEEGIHFPSIRVVREYEEVSEMVRFFKVNFRYPERWYGDFLAQIGSLRRAETEIVKLCKKYGAEVIKRFQNEFTSYGDRRMREEISKLPKGAWQTDALSEKIEPWCPKGIPLKVKMSIDPEKAEICFDLREMPDNLPWGRNLSEATSKGACIQATMACLDPTLPSNDGVFKHFKFLLREGAVVGIPKWPASTSAATIGIADHISNLIFELWERVEPGRGHASSGYLAACGASTSGIDFRTNQAYGHIHFLAVSGGGASLGYDGWPNFFAPAIQGCMFLDSVELTELAIPETIWELGIVTDSGGAGKWRGGVATFFRIQPRSKAIYGIPKAYGHTARIFGVKGGRNGSNARHWLEKHPTMEKVEELKNSGEFLVNPDSYWIAQASGGGGYGNPFERNPEAVREDVQNNLVSEELARNVYAVILKRGLEFNLFEVDYMATKQLRYKSRKKSKGGVRK
ncbi:hypothetical protein LCGC14_1151380 [marine sediment metagenome]|uniref:Hydantoinase B/oxoprolinase domain-containing protein n=1 Tax=marine sediment metagenome TaxID=412755 RepID=A0A0F9MIK8_9ZZZZ|nr:hydantoinase B/oxoprolinase family protein [Desulfobacterales bacterium]